MIKFQHEHVLYEGGSPEHVVEKVVEKQLKTETVDRHVSMKCLY